MGSTLQNGLAVASVALLALTACESEAERLRKEREEAAMVLAADLADRRQRSDPPSVSEFKIRKLAGETREQIAQQLGEPESCEPTNLGDLCRYPSSGAEIVFRSGRADRLTLPAHGAPFLPGAVSRLGLDPTPPTVATDSVIRWQRIDGLAEVALFRGRENAAGYFYVTVQEP